MLLVEWEANRLDWFVRLLEDAVSAEKFIQR